MPYTRQHNKTEGKNSAGKTIKLDNDIRQMEIVTKNLLKVHGHMSLLVGGTEVQTIEIMTGTMGDTMIDTMMRVNIMLILTAEGAIVHVLMIHIGNVQTVITKIHVTVIEDNRYGRVGTTY